MKSLWCRFINDKSGTTAIEFAILGTSFILLLLSIIELGRYFFTWNSLQYAIEQATRYALVSEDATIGEVEEYAVSQMPTVLINPDNLSMEIVYTNSSGIDFIELRGTYDYKIFSPVLPGGLLVPTDMRVNARMPVQ